MSEMQQLLSEKNMILQWLPLSVWKEIYYPDTLVHNYREIFEYEG